MMNAEVRKKALTKVKVKNLTFLAVLSYVFYWLSQFARGATGDVLRDALIGAGTALVLSLFFPAGLARASMTAWRQNEARFSTYFASFYRPRALVRALALGVVAAVFRFCLSYLLTDAVLLRFDALPGHGLWLLAIAVILFVPLLFAWFFLYFALELQPEIGLGKALARGMRVIVQNGVRILTMEFVILWWVVLAYAAAVVISIASGLGGAVLNAVTSLIALVLTWMIGAYVCLVNAGLAREIFKD